MTVEDMFKKFVQRAGLSGVPEAQLSDVRSVFHFGVLECIGAQTAMGPGANVAAAHCEWIKEIRAFGQSAKEAACVEA